MLPLFAYGTLRDAELQTALFDRSFETTPATLHGYVCVSGGDYFSARRQPGGIIRGALVALDEAAYAVADRWENLEVYARKAGVALDLAGRIVPCFFYLKSHAHGAIVDDERISDRSRSEMLADIREFRASL